MKLYGNVINRIEEKGNSAEVIEVGMGVTEYLWSDRNAYEVTKVVNQKDVFIRRYDAKNIGSGFGDNSWELISNPNNREMEVVFRYNNWYKKEFSEYQNKYVYTKMNIRFGVADYYYDFEF